jgi:hypothetical protein
LAMSSVCSNQPLRLQHNLHCRDSDTLHSSVYSYFQISHFDFNTIFNAEILIPFIQAYTHIFKSVISTSTQSSVLEF